jgi:hypothetical protein
MRPVDGSTLLEHVQRRRPGALQRLQLLLPVFEALAHAHDEGVAHGDIRPANVRVDDDGKAWLIDWGEGRLLLPRTAAADIRALTELLALALGGCSPGPDLRAVLARGQGEAPVEPPVEQAVEQAGGRYERLQPMIDDLRRVLAHLPVAGLHATPVHRAGLFARRHPLALTASAVGAVMLTVAFTLLVRHIQTGREQQVRSDRARAFVQQVAGVEPDAAAGPAQQAARLQRALDQARTGFDGEPVLRGLVLTELALGFRAVGQPEQALTVLREAHALLQSTAARNDPALGRARAQLALQLLDEPAASAQTQALALARQVVVECSSSACAPARLVAREVIQRLDPPAER